MSVLPLGVKSDKQQMSRLNENVACFGRNSQQIIIIHQK